MSALHFPFLHVLWHVHAMMTILSQSCKWLRMAISWGYLVGCKLGWNGGGNLQWLLYSGSSHQCGGIVQEVSFACSTPGFHSCWIQLGAHWRPKGL